MSKENKKSVHEKLKSASAEYNSVFENSRDAIMLLDDTGFFDCNEATVQMFRCDSISHFCSFHPKDFSPQFQFDGCSSDDLSQEKITQAFEEGHAHFNWIHKRLGGDEFEAEVTLNLIEIDHQKFLMAFVKDISDRVALERELKEKNENFITMLESIPGYVSWLTSDFHYKYVNDTLADYFSISRDSFIGKKMGFNESKTSSEIIGLCRRLSEENEESAQKEVIIDTINKGPRNILITCKRFDNKKGFIVIGIDNTELKDTQMKLAAEKQKIEDQAKLVALGEMAGGIGHEIVNPLSIVDGYLKVIGKKGGELIAKEVAKAQNSIERIGKIVKGLSRLSRQSEGDPIVKLMIGDIIEDTLTFCATKLKTDRIELLIEDYDKERIVFGRHVEICQVLLNLVNNARHAIENCESRWLRIEFEESDNQFHIRVIDSGVGILEENKEKIFKSFFTTKSVGKGTGLGLSLSKKLMRELGGDLELDPYNENTCFIVKIPLQKD